MWSHALSGLCAAGSGVPIYAVDKGKNWGLLFMDFFDFAYLGWCAQGFTCVYFDTRNSAEFEI